jgi:hypothetical protein
MVYLVRLILDPDWQPKAAAARLRELVGDERVLRQMAARVHRAMVDRPSEIAERAALTLAEAIGEPDRRDPEPPAGDCVMADRQRTRAG